MATGELSNGETARLEVRKALVEHDYVDCMVQLTGQLFANTQIPCSLWFLSKNRGGGDGFRKRQGEILFIDGRKLGHADPGLAKAEAALSEDIERIAACMTLSVPGRFLSKRQALPLWRRSKTCDNTTMP